MNKEQLELNMDATILKPLLINIQEEEPDMVAKLKEKFEILSINFKKSILIISDRQVYKSYSLYGLLTCYNRLTKYFVANLAMLLDIWYNKHEFYTKMNLINPDVLIISGLSSGVSYHLDLALAEIVTYRRNLGKVTWIFIFSPYYEQISKELNLTVKAIGSSRIISKN